MPVKYSQDFQIPAEFPDILRDLTKEILRCQPKNIDAFGKLSLKGNIYNRTDDKYDNLPDWRLILSSFSFMCAAYEYFAHKLRETNLNAEEETA